MVEPHIVDETMRLLLWGNDQARRKRRKGPRASLRNYQDNAMSYLPRPSVSWFDAVKKLSAAKTPGVTVRKVPLAVDLRAQSRLTRAAALDMSQLLVPREVSAVSAIHGVTMAAGAKMTLAITLQMPAGAPSPANAIALTSCSATATRSSEGAPTSLPQPEIHLGLWPL